MKLFQTPKIVLCSVAIVVVICISFLHMPIAQARTSQTPPPIGCPRHFHPGVLCREASTPGCYPSPMFDTQVLTPGGIITPRGRVIAVIGVQACFEGTAGNGVVTINFLPIKRAKLLNGKKFFVLNQNAPIAAWIIKVYGHQYLIMVTFASQNGVWFINSINVF